MSVAIVYRYNPSCIYQSQLKVLSELSNKVLNLFGLGKPVVQKCNKMQNPKVVDATLSRHFNRLVELYTYIINQNELLGAKIQQKWIKHFQLYSVKQHQRLSAWNTLCSKLYLNVPIYKINALNNVMKYLNLDPVFATNSSVMSIQRSFLPMDSFWTVMPAISTFKTAFTNKHNNIHVYNIDVGEGLARNHDAWINNNLYKNYNGLLGSDCVLAILSADKCTADGMQALGLFCESVCCILGDKSQSSYTSTVISCCFGGVKDTTESFIRLYQQHNLKQRMDSMFKRPCIISLCLHNTESRMVSSCILNFDTNIHTSLNAFRCNDLQTVQDQWDQNNQFECKDNQILTDVSKEIETEYETINTRERDILGMDQIRQKRNTNTASHKLQYQWYNEFTKIKQWLANVKFTPQQLPIRGVNGNNLSDINTLIHEVCHESNNHNFKPFLDDFNFNVSIYICTNNVIQS